MNRFVLKNTFHKSIHIPFFDKYFYKNKELKLDFGDRIVILNGFLYGYGGSIAYMQRSTYRKAGPELNVSTKKTRKEDLKVKIIKLSGPECGTDVK